MAPRPSGTHARDERPGHPVPTSSAEGGRPPNATTGSVQDIGHRVLGRPCAGTDHVFRLNGPRVEASSGLDEGLFDLLAKGRVLMALLR